MNNNDNTLTLDSSNFYALSAASSLAILTAYYVFSVAQVPKIYTSNNSLKDFLLSHVTTLQDKYWPNVFYWEGRLQSVLGLSQRLPRSLKLPYVREIITLTDGGEIGLDYLHPTDYENSNEQRLIVMLFPGLTSSSQSSYVKTLAMAITKAGGTIVVMNNRGMGGVSLKTNRLFCASRCDDLKEVATYVRNKYPKDRLMAIGTSLGGMILSKYLIQHSEDAREVFECCLLISICWNAANAVENLEKPFINKYIVNKGMVWNLRFLTNKYRDILETPECNFDKILTSGSLREFDSSFTAPHFGYKSAMDYYEEAKICDNIHKFPIPVFSLNALDDPIANYLPIKQAQEEDSKLVMIVTERGGHLGFLEGTLPFRQPVHYMERVVSEFVAAVRLFGDDLKK